MSFFRVFFLTTFGLLACLAQPAFGDVVGEEPRFIRTQLGIAPVAVIARMEQPVAVRAEEFTVNVEEPFVEVYTHYFFSVERVLKGQLPEEGFTVRVIGGEAGGVVTKPVLEFEPGEPVLLLLTPDLGVDPSGQSRSGYLIPYKAKYPIADNQVTVPTSQGDATWSLTRIEEEIVRILQQERERLNRNPEPLEARTIEVVAGEQNIDEQPGPQPPPSEILREPARTPDEELAEISPFLLQQPPGTRPDLVVAEFSVADAQSLPLGTQIGERISLAIANQGQDDVQESFFIGLYVSPDDIITTSDRLLIGGRESVSEIAANTTLPVNATAASVPEDFGSGQAFLGVIVDEFDAISEEAEDNNAQAVPVTLVPPPIVIEISREGDQAVLSWGDSGTLQSAPTVSGPWTSTGEQSPLTIPLEGTRFFRVVE